MCSRGAARLSVVALLTVGAIGVGLPGLGAVEGDVPTGGSASAVSTPDVVTPEGDSDARRDGWVDPTLPQVLLDDADPAADADTDPVATPESSVASKPKPDREKERRAHADAAPPISPGFVDDYARLWRAIEAGIERVAELKSRVALAQATADAASGDLSLAMRVRNRAEFEYAGAADELDTAAMDLYISGTTDMGVVIGVLGSEPDDLLRTIDSVIYLRSATGNEDLQFRTSREGAVVAQSAAAATLIDVTSAREEQQEAEAALARVRARLADNREELDALIASAAPQTVVGPSGCPKAVLDGTVPSGVDVRTLCRKAVAGASTPQAAFAIKWALVRLGAPYACDGVGRLAPWRYDCSSYVSRAYAEGAGMETATASWAPSTRMMLPWGGAERDPHYATISPERIRPGDLVLYDTCPAGETCDYRHVVMYLGSVEPGGPPLMAHTNSCGAVAHVAPFWGTSADNFLGVRRVIPSSGERAQTS